MVIVSPYAKHTYTDSNAASYASILAFIEHALNVPALNAADAAAYDYSSSFDYTQTPTAKTARALRHYRVPKSSLRWMRTHPPQSHDPT